MITKQSEDGKTVEKDMEKDKTHQEDHEERVKVKGTETIIKRRDKNVKRLHEKLFIMHYYLQRQALFRFSWVYTFSSWFWLEREAYELWQAKLYFVRMSLLILEENEDIGGRIRIQRFKDMKIEK